MFHPAAALHQPHYRSLIEHDFLKLPQLLADLHAVEGEPEEPEPPKQLSLF
jgi:DNA polymerase